MQHVMCARASSRQVAGPPKSPCPSHVKTASGDTRCHVQDFIKHDNDKCLHFKAPTPQSCVCAQLCATHKGCSWNTHVSPVP